MSQREAFLSALAAVCVFHVGAAQAADGAGVSGVSGRISQAPTSSGPERIGHEGAAAALANVNVQLRNAKLDMVAQAATDRDGRFKIHAPAGSYTVLVEIKSKLPRCEMTPITISSAKMSKLDIECDSGMR